MVADNIFALRDSGVPPNSDDYTTLIMIHGIAWHSGVFSKFLPLASSANARVVLLNRRDYPGSARISDQERSALEGITSMTAEAAQETLRNHMRTRAQELYRFMIEFVKKEPVTLSGGLVLAGWSFGCNFITAFLAESLTFPSTPDDARLLERLRRVVIYDPPYHALGYSSPSDWYNPLFDPSLTPNEAPQRFMTWVSGYYKHGDSILALEQRNALAYPQPTVLTISQEDIDAAVDIAPTLPGGSDSLILSQGIRHGLFTMLRKAAVYGNVNVNGNVSAKSTNCKQAQAASQVAGTRGWSDVKLSYIWCDHSEWEMPYGAFTFQAEMDEAKRMGRRTRDVKIVRMRGANHFLHWDQPILALRAIIA